MDYLPCEHEQFEQLAPHLHGLLSPVQGQAIEANEAKLDKPNIKPSVIIFFMIFFD